MGLDTGERMLHPLCRFAPALKRFSEIICCVFLVLTLALSKGFAATPDLHCKACKDFVGTFRKGYENTARSNFGGGNTDWEETRLGSYATSETRLVEILEHACTDGSDKDMCHQFVENHEEQIEKWYFHLQNNDPDLEKWLCITSTKVCCPNNTFGPDCKPCAGLVNGEACMGRGSCEGSGTRKGSGKCRCQKGYGGEICAACGSGYEFIEKNETFVECRDTDECSDPLICPAADYCYNTEGSFKCSKCHQACKGCTGAGAARCKECAKGFVLSNGTCTDEQDDEEDGTVVKQKSADAAENRFGLRPTKSAESVDGSSLPSDHAVPHSEL